MAKKNDCWGIEVGANAIKAMHLIREGDKLRLADYEILPFKKVLTTPDLNVDEAIQLNLDQLVSRHDFSKSTVMVSLPGNMAFARFAKLPPVDPKQIPNIVKFEAQQQIPFPIDQVEWDYQVFAHQDSPDVEVGIFAITKDRVMSFLSNYRTVGLTIDGLTLSPLAVFNALAYEQDKADDGGTGAIYVDVGTTSTDVIIVEEGHIWLRTLPIGGNNFTDALVRAFKLSFPKAEKLKREAATSKYARQIFQAMRPIFADLVQELQRSIGYYQSLNREARLTRLVGIGSTFRLPGLQKFLKQQLQMEIVRPDGFKRLEISGKQESEIAENALNLITAYGLALQGLGMGMVKANVLPAHIIKQRLWRTKQPWIAAAAVLMLVASGGAYVRYYNDSAAYQAGVDTHAQRIDQAINLANARVAEWSGVEQGSDPRQRIENLRRILDYRDVWPGLMHDLHLAKSQVGTQPELFTTDYQRITQIRRDQRRAIYIDSITAEYIFEFDEATKAAAASAGTTPVASGLTLEQIFGSRRRMPTAPGGPGIPGGPPIPGAPPGMIAPTPPAQPQSAQPEAAAQAATSPPKFLITVRGSTPFANGPAFVSENFIRWLQQATDRSDRPYRIIAGPDSLAEIKQVGDEADRDAQSGNNVKSTPSRPLRGSTPPTAAPLRGTRPLPTPGGRIPPGVENQGTATIQHQTFDLDQLLPQRPTREELRRGDWRFELRWTIQLVRPEDARLAEEATSTPESPNSPQTPTTPTTPPLNPTKHTPTDAPHTADAEARVLEREPKPDALALVHRQPQIKEDRP